MHDFKQDPRFKGIEPFSSKLWLSSPTMHGDEQKWVDDAIQKNWVSTVGENINEVERQTQAVYTIINAYENLPRINHWIGDPYYAGDAINAGGRYE